MCCRDRCRSGRGRFGIEFPAAGLDHLAVLATSIIRQIESLGYVVKEFRVNNAVEYHAVPRDSSAPQVARCNDGADDESAYRAACMLAEAVGIDLEDG